jgi:hypothetical protein
MQASMSFLKNVQDKTKKHSTGFMVTSGLVILGFGAYFNWGEMGLLFYSMLILYLLSFTKTDKSGTL